MIVVIVVMITVAIVAVVVGGRAVAPTIPSSVSATAAISTTVATWVVAATVTVISSSSPRRIRIPVPVRHATGHKDRQDHGGGKCRKGDAKIHSGIGNELDGLLPIAFKTMEK